MMSTTPTSANKMNQIKIQTEVCYYITASNLANEFYELDLDAASEAIESIIGAADLASVVEGDIGRAMVTIPMFIKMMDKECETEIAQSIRKVLEGLYLDKNVYIDIYN